MKSRNERKGIPLRTTSAPPAPRKRFLIEKLEERIAPKKGGNGTHNCGGGPSDTISGGNSSVY